MFPPFFFKFKLITLITYLLSRTLILSCPWLGLAYLSLHLTQPDPTVVVTYQYQHTWFCLFYLFLFFAPIIFFVSVCQTKIWFFEISPWVLSLTFHFSIFSCPLTLPDLTSASLLHLVDTDTSVSALSKIRSKMAYLVVVAVINSTCMHVSTCKYLYRAL